jgi:hypothetical protein
MQLCRHHQRTVQGLLLARPPAALYASAAARWLRRRPHLISWALPWLVSVPSLSRMI